MIHFTISIHILGIRNYQCDKCDKAFYIEFNLKRHIATQHEGLRFKCDQCLREFTEKSRLQTHIDFKHNNIKQKCEFCDKMYGGEGLEANMKRHILQCHSTDTDENAVKCEQCDKKFFMKDYLIKHIRAVHERIKDHLCMLCGKGFGQVIF